MVCCVIIKCAKRKRNKQSDNGEKGKVSIFIFITPKWLLRCRREFRMVNHESPRGSGWIMRRKKKVKNESFLRARFLHIIYKSDNLLFLTRSFIHTSTISKYIFPFFRLPINESLVKHAWSSLNNGPHHQIKPFIPFSQSAVARHNEIISRQSAGWWRRRVQWERRQCPRL